MDKKDLIRIVLLLVIVLLQAIATVQFSYLKSLVVDVETQVQRLTPPLVKSCPL